MTSSPPSRGTSPENIASCRSIKHDNSLTVAIADPSDLDTIDSLTHLLQAEIDLRVASEADIEAALGKYYAERGGGVATDPRLKEAIEDLTREHVEVEAAAAADGAVVEADAPLIKLVNSIIVEAFKMRASDIHLEPLSKTFRMRYRIDGVLHEMKAPPKRLQAAIISRLKIQSNMSISEHRIPQDGRIQTSVGGKLIDLRVSCLPTNHGESIVMRILDKEGLRLGLPELGFFTDDQQTFERLIGLPDGILLVTGPTGSGKTTTLYSCLHFINRPDRKIITVEDPVEYLLSGINQVQVNEAVGLTFAVGPALDPAPGAQRDHDRGNPRPGDRHHRHQCLAHRPPGLLHPAHQRRAERRHPPDRHRRQAVPGGLLHARFDGPAAGAQSVPASAPAPACPRKRRCARWAWMRPASRAPPSSRAKAAPTAPTPATAAASASSRSSSLTTRRAS